MFAPKIIVIDFMLSTAHYSTRTALRQEKGGCVEDTKRTGVGYEPPRSGAVGCFGSVHVRSKERKTERKPLRSPYMVEDKMKKMKNCYLQVYNTHKMFRIKH